MRRHVCLLFLLLLAAPLAQADLMLHPTRLVFDKAMRSAQVELINNGSENATYRVTLVNRRMGESGGFSAAAEALPGELFADAMLRFAPRQVTLAPGASQTVRVMLRKPAELAPGEYRSHLHFEKLPPPAAAPDPAAPGQIGIALTVLVGASIPVIVRHGDLQASVALSGLAFQDGEAPCLALQLERSGGSSVYGDLAVTFTPRGGQPVEVARVGGVAVYTPNALRRASLRLNPPPGLTLAQGVLRASFRERPGAGGRLLAEAALALP